MKISMQALGTLGDVQPCLNLARVFRARGHTVSLLAPADFRERIEAEGVTAARPAPFRVAAWMEEAATRGTLQNPVAFFRDWDRMIQPHLDAVTDASLAAATGCDLVFANLICAPARLAAEYHRVPLVLHALQPVLTPTADVPCAMVMRRGRGGPLNRASYGAVALALALVGQGLKPHRRRLGLGRAADLPDLRQHLGRDLPRITSSPPAMLDQRPRDWPAASQLTAYPSLPRGTDWQPDAALARFLAAGPPPVHVGLGSMPVSQARPLLRTLLAGLALAGHRALLDRNLTRETGLDLADHFEIGPTPHDSLFPLCAAVIHHGGAGTLDTAVRAGVAQVLIPQMMDQHWHACRLHQAGLSGAPLPAAFTARQLAGRLTDIAQPARLDRIEHARDTALQRDGCAEVVSLVEAAAQRF